MKAPEHAEKIENKDIVVKKVPMADDLIYDLTKRKPHLSKGTAAYIEEYNINDIYNSHNFNNFPVILIHSIAYNKLMHQKNPINKHGIYHNVS